MFHSMVYRPSIPFADSRPSVAGEVVKLRARRLPVPMRRRPTRLRVSASTIREPGLPGFLRWLARDFPAVHERLRAQRPDLLSTAMAGLGQAEPVAAKTTGQKIADFVLPLLQVYQQREILKLQLKRAQAGQPPLDVESLTMPAARVEIEAGKETRRTGLIALGIGAALGAVLWFTGRRRA